MNEPRSMLVGGWTVVPARNRLERGGVAIKLEPRGMDLLVYLAGSGGRVVSADELLREVWQGRVFDDGIVYKKINQLRKALGAGFIETIPKRGYRLVAPVALSDATADPAVVSASALGGLPHVGRNAGYPSRTNRAFVSAGTIVLALALGFAYSYWSTPATDAVAEQSVVVLPFSDLSENGDQRWLADGMTEEILNALAKLPELQVTARASSFRFTGSDRAPEEIATTLRVGHVLHGSVRRAAERLRVSVQLVRTRDGAQLWANAYDRTVDDLFEVQRDVAEKVAAALDVVLDAERRERMFRSGTRNVEAFEAFQKGWAIYQDVHYAQSEQTLWDANVYFERAMGLDPRYSQAAAAHSDVFAHQVVRGPVGELAANSPYSQQEALALFSKDIDIAAANASSAAERWIYEINREVFSPTWNRLPDLIERLRAEDRDFGGINFETTGALHFILEVTGDLDLLRELAEAQLKHDPLSVEAWLANARLELIAGNFRAVGDVVMRARRVLGDQPSLSGVELGAALVGHQRSEVRRVLEAQGRRGHYWAALEGDYEMARKLTGELEGQSSWLAASLACLITYNEIAAEDRTRELAGRIDRLPGGSAIFVSFMGFTGNTLLFDLDDTPNFAANLRQAGIDPARFNRLPRLRPPANIATR